MLTLVAALAALGGAFFSDQEREKASRAWQLVDEHMDCLVAAAKRRGLEGDDDFQSLVEQFHLQMLKVPDGESRQKTRARAYAAAGMVQRRRLETSEIIDPQGYSATERARTVASPRLLGTSRYPWAATPGTPEGPAIVHPPEIPWSEVEKALAYVPKKPGRPSREEQIDIFKRYVQRQPLPPSVSQADAHKLYAHYRHKLRTLFLIDEVPPFPGGFSVPVQREIARACLLHEPGHRDEAREKVASTLDLDQAKETLEIGASGELRHPYSLDGFAPRGDWKLQPYPELQFAPTEGAVQVLCWYYQEWVRELRQQQQPTAWWLR